MSIFQQLHERVVDRLVDDAVDKNVGAFFHGGAGRFQFGGVNGHANFVGVTLANGRANDRPKRVDRMILIDDVPDFNEIWILRRQFADELPRLIGSIDFDDRRITQVELLAGHTGNQRSGYGHTRPFRG